MSKAEGKDNREPGPLFSREELMERTRELAVPLDLESLQRSGILRKSGSWYEVLDWERLPEHAKVKISAIETGEKRRVKFEDTSRAAAKLLKSLQEQKD